jgi:hypothetical protein
MDRLTYEDFLKVLIRVGQVIQVDGIPKARQPAYELRKAV